MDDSDRNLWRKIKRNGYFACQKRKLLNVTVDNAESSEEFVTYNSTCASNTAGESAGCVFDNEEVSDSDDDIDDTTDQHVLCTDLRDWAIMHQVKHAAINALLVILKSSIPNNVLPKDARTLLQTPRSTAICSTGNLGGSYWHYGLKKSLVEAVSTIPSKPLELSLNVNIDGLPAFKSSSKSMWPILINLHELKDMLPPMVVGIFCGLYKPKDVNAFLEPFVSELNDVLMNGIEIDGKQITVKVRCFICDTPARSMLRGVIGHNGYNSCLKCITEGEYSSTAKTMIFPEIDAPLRTDEGFRSRQYEGHHKHDSVLESINGLDMIQDFPIGDSLHLIDLGITKRFLNGWKNGSLNNLNAKWTARQIEEVSNFLNSCKLPREMRRPARGLEHLSRWKATEFRTFLLYISPVVVKQFFDSQEISDHFLNFFCAIQICSRHDQSSENYEVAESLIQDFLKGVKVLYGTQHFCSNMHNLTHLIEDVKRFGPLDSFDAYPFESKLFTLKRMIRSGNLPLSQVSRRIIEMQSSFVNLKSSNQSKVPVLKKKYALCEDEQKALANFVDCNSCATYAYVKLDNFCLDSESSPNRWILTSDLKIVSVNFIVHTSEKNAFHLFGCPLQTIFDFFDKPVLSSSLHIYGSDLQHSQPQLFNVNHILCKMIKIDCRDKKMPKSVFLPLIHTLR